MSFAGRRPDPGIPFHRVYSDHTLHPKVQLLYITHKGEGYWVWCCLRDKIYKELGYYMDTSDEEVFTLFCTNTCKHPPEFVRNVIERCLEVKLFSRPLYEEHKILTSKRIQEIYLDATRERRRKGTIISIKRHFLCLSPEQFNSSAEQFLNRVHLDGGQNPSPRNNTESSAEQIGIFRAENTHSKSKSNSDSKSIKDNTLTTGTVKSLSSNSSLVEKNFQQVAEPKNGENKQEESKPPPGPAGGKPAAEKKGKPRREKIFDGFPHWQVMVSIYNQFYRDRKGVDPHLQKQDYAHMHTMLGYLKKEVEEKPEEWNVQNASLAWNEFLQWSWLFDPKWLQKNFSPSNLVKRYSDIKSFAISPKEREKFTPPRQKVPRSEYHAFAKELYIQAFKNEKHFIPKIDDRDEEALDKLIWHILASPQKTDDDVPQLFLENGLNYIFTNWKKLSPYLQENMDLKNIFTNLNKISEQLKNPKNGHAVTTNGFHQEREARYDFDFASTYNKLDPRLR